MPEDGKLAETGVAKPDSCVMKRTRCRWNCVVCVMKNKQGESALQTYLRKFGY